VATKRNKTTELTATVYKERKKERKKEKKKGEKIRETSGETQLT
jgi:hypothetical protein